MHSLAGAATNSGTGVGGDLEHLPYPPNMCRPCAAQCHPWEWVSCCVANLWLCASIYSAICLAVTLMCSLTHLTETLALLVGTQGLAPTVPDALTGHRAAPLGLSPTYITSIHRRVRQHTLTHHTHTLMGSTHSRCDSSPDTHRNPPPRSPSPSSNLDQGLPSRGRLG